MRLLRVRAVARKEFLHVIRDPLSLGMGIAIPLIMMFLFGYALSLDVDNVPLVVWDQSNTATSREFISRFTGSRYFSLKGYAHGYGEIEEAIDTREAMVALVIPVNFAQEIDAGRSSPVQVIADGSDSNTATLALGYADAVTQAYSQTVAIEQARRASGVTVRAPLDARPRVWFNEDLQSKNFIIPGLIAVIMMVISALLTSLTVSREWEEGTMEQLISTPVKGSELIFGKLIPYFAIGMLDVLLSVTMGYFLFHVPMRGSLLLLFLVAAIFLIGVLALGMYISIIAKNQRLANQLAMLLTFLPAYILSGFMFPIKNMPAPIRPVTYLVPARYFISMIKGIYLKGVGLEILWPDMLFLVVFSAAMLVLANVAFKKRLV